MPKIELPEPVIKTVVLDNGIPWRGEGYFDTYRVGVEVGGILVMERTYYSNRPYPYSLDCALDEEQALENVLEEFGKNLRSLFSQFCGEVLKED